MRLMHLAASAAAVTLAIAPVWSDDGAARTGGEAGEPAHEGHVVASEGDAPAQLSEDLMFSQFNAIRAQLKLGPVGRERHAQVREELVVLKAEAESALGPDASPEQLQAFYRARSAGYQDTEEMEADMEALFGARPKPGAVRAYLMLRRAERYAHSGPEPDYETLRSAVAEMDKATPGAIRRLTRTYRAHRPPGRPERPGSRNGQDG